MTGPMMLRPALALADRLRTSARLAALAGILLVPAVYATWSFVTVIGGQVAFTQAERGGVDVLRPALTALASTTAAAGTPRPTWTPSAPRPPRTRNWRSATPSPP